MTARASLLLSAQEEDKSTHLRRFRCSLGGFGGLFTMK